MKKTKRTVHPSLVVVLASVSLLALSGEVSAQHVDATVDAPPGPTEEFTSSVGYSHVFDADIDRRGNFHLDTLQTRLNAAIPVGDRLRIGGFFGYEYSSYDFSGNSDFQWDEIHMFQFGPLASWAASERLRLLGGGVFRFAAEDDADYGESFTAGGFAGFTFTPPESNLMLGAALALMGQIEDDPAVAPIPLVNWRIARDWALRSRVIALGGRIGPGVEVAHDVNEQFELAAGLQFQRRRFRLNEEDRVGEESSIPIFAKLTWKPIGRFSLEGIIGVAVAGDLRLEDSDGDRLASQDYNPALVLGTQLSVSF